MKPSTAIRKARNYNSLSPIGNQWQVIYRPIGQDYTTSTNSTTYAQAKQWYKECIASTALELMGWDAEDTMMVRYNNNGLGTAQELVERCIEERYK